MYFKIFDIKGKRWQVTSNSDKQKYSLVPVVLRVD